MGSCYELRISSDSDQKIAIESILGKSDGDPDFSWWRMVIEEDAPLFNEALPHFLNLLEHQIDELTLIGISADLISIWYLYAYEGQCNMEFGPDFTRRLGKLGVSLCISCWEK
ncbi:hypothetical protein [Pedobacter caeni]|uniref:DUF4279 domain-containing protein n=1 Tax=Pedobacter caeni TaxID=288992 RepID=A0A1M5JKT6_9SPHI|nr:hypothetical protein [Pedobacter caeni]SHG40879.1 hypothetical protein SAMN04488522_105393 [Pedobacter caeni]